MSPPQRDLPGCGGALGPREKELGPTEGAPLPREQMGSESVSSSLSTATNQLAAAAGVLAQRLGPGWDRDGDGDRMGCIGEQGWVWDEMRTGMGIG